jgi:hypothetical protein
MFHFGSKVRVIENHGKVNKGDVGVVIAKATAGDLLHYLVEFEGRTDLHDGNGHYDIWSSEIIKDENFNNRWWLSPHSLEIIDDINNDPYNDWIEWEGDWDENIKEEYNYKRNLFEIGDIVVVNGTKDNKNFNNDIGVIVDIKDNFNLLVEVEFENRKDLYGENKNRYEIFSTQLKLHVTNSPQDPPYQKNNNNNMFKKGDIVKVIDYDHLNRNEYSVLKKFKEFVVYSVTKDRIGLLIDKNIYSFDKNRFVKVGNIKKKTVNVNDEKKRKTDEEIINDLLNKTLDNKITWSPFEKNNGDIEYVYSKKITPKKVLIFRIIIYDYDITESTLIISYYNGTSMKNINRFKLIENNMLLDLFYTITEDDDVH